MGKPFPSKSTAIRIKRMTKKAKTMVAVVLYSIIAVGVFKPAYALTPITLTAIFGKPVHIFADPSDFVVELNTAGPCGSKFFHIQRQKENFKELTAVALTAFSGGKIMTFFVNACDNDRNFVSHGFAAF